MASTPKTTGIHSDEGLSISGSYSGVFSPANDLKTEIYKIAGKDRGLFDRIQASTSGY